MRNENHVLKIELFPVVVQIVLVEVKIWVKQALRQIILRNHLQIMKNDAHVAKGWRNSTKHKKKIEIKIKQLEIQKKKLCFPLNSSYWIVQKLESWSPSTFLLLYTESLGFLEFVLQISLVQNNRFSKRKLQKAYLYIII